MNNRDFALRIYTDFDYSCMVVIDYIGMTVRITVQIREDCIRVSYEQ